MNRIEEAMSKVNLSWWDKAVTLNNPGKLASRLKDKKLLALAGAYNGASHSRRQTKSWKPSAADADSDILYDLPDLRERSRDLCRNAPLAIGAINTKVTSVIGAGLRLNANVDASLLGISPEEAKALNRKIENEYALFEASCDLNRTHHGRLLHSLIYRSAKENGDILINMPMVERPESPYMTKLQLIEADRLSNPNKARDTAELAGGVEKDRFGAPKFYHIQRTHPGSELPKFEWDKLRAYGPRTGRRNVIHYFDKKRVGQTRGVPDLAPVIETLKKLDMYTEAEITAAVVSGMFAVFVKTENGQGLGPMGPADDVGGSVNDKDYKLQPGAMVDLLPGESIDSANPGRPNQAFDPFVLAILRQVGVALELPFELLVKHFTASYSAARAALLEAWRYFMSEREKFAEMVLTPIYEAFFEEAVALGRINAPEFLSGDPLIKKAYLTCTWKGAAKGQIDELKEIKAAELRINAGVSTLQAETTELTSGDWETNHTQQVIERNARKADGLYTDPSVYTRSAESQVKEEEQKKPEEEDDESK